MPRRFGFDDAGLGFDLGPFAPNSPPESEVVAAASYGAASFAVSVVIREPTRRAVTVAGPTYAAATYASVSVSVGEPARRAVTAAVTRGAAVPSVQVSVREPTRHEVEVSRSTGAATYTAAVLRTDLLQLSDFPNPDLDFDWLALLERSTSAPDLYLGVPRNGFDTPLAGEVGMSDDEEPITRVQILSSTRLRLNDNGSLELTDYFSGDGAGADLTLYFVNDELEVAATTIVRLSGGGGFFNFTIPEEMGQFINAIAVGERYLFAGARARRGANYAVTAGYTVAGATYTAAVLRRVPARRVVTTSLNVPAPAYGVSVQVREPTRHAVQAGSTVAGASYGTVAVGLRVVVMHVVTAGATFAVSTSTAAVFNRNAERLPVTAARAFAGLTGSAAVQVQGTVQHAVEASRLFGTAIATTSIQRREPLRKAVEATRNHGPYEGGTVSVNVRAPDRHAVIVSIIRKPITSTTQVGRRVPARLSVTAARPFPVFTSTAAVQSRLFLVTASRAFGGMSSTAAIQTREPDRHAVTAAYTVGGATGTVAVQKRLADRVEVTASATYSAATSTAAVYRRLSVTASTTFGVATSTVMVQGRTSTRRRVTAGVTYSAATGTVAVALRQVQRHAVTAAVGSPVASFGSSVQVREPARHAVTAGYTAAGITATAMVLGRIADRVPVTAAVTLPALTATSTANKKLPVTAAVTYGAFTATLDILLERRARRPVTADVTYAAAITYTAAVQKRLSARREVQADVTYGVAAYTAPVYRRLPVTATSAYGAFTSALTVQIRGATRHAVVAGIIYSGTGALTAVNVRGAVRKAVQAGVTYGVSSAAVMVSTRTAMQKAVEASVTHNAASYVVSVQTRRIIRHAVTLNAVTRGAATYTAAIQKRAARNMELMAAVTYGAPVYASTVSLLTAPQIAVIASTTYAAFTSTLQVTKGAAMPPAQVMNVRLIQSGFTTLLIGWDQPDVGTGTLLQYEYQVDGGVWVGTMSVTTEVEIGALTSDTAYAIRIRAQSTVGRGSASMPLNTRTSNVTAPSVPRFLTATPTGSTSVDLTWQLPMSTGGSDITSYEVQVVYPDNTMSAYESMGSMALMHRVNGLGYGYRYGFRVRARNSMGVSPATDLVYAVPVRIEGRVIPDGTVIPLLDTDRQSLIVRLGTQDCRITVWWQPETEDESWYASLEVPVNTPVTRSRRLANHSGLLDRQQGILPGNLVLRPLSDVDTAEPDRNAWSEETHGLRWEPE